MENNIIEEFKEYSDKVTATKESSQQFLQDIGVNDIDGNLTEQYGGKVKFNYEGLNTTLPERFDGESMQEYHVRRKITNMVFKRRIRGVLAYDNNKNKSETGKNIPYIKPKENESTTT